MDIPFAVAEYSDGSGFDVNPVIDPNNVRNTIVTGEDHKLTDYDGYTDIHVRVYPEYWKAHPEAATQTIG